MGCFEKLSWIAEDAAPQTDWVEISRFDATARVLLWRHLRSFHPSLAQLLGNAEQSDFAQVGGAEIWIERRYLPAAPR